MKSYSGEYDDCQRSYTQIHPKKFSSSVDRLSREDACKRLMTVAWKDRGSANSVTMAERRTVNSPLAVECRQRERVASEL